MDTNLLNEIFVQVMEKYNNYVQDIFFSSIKISKHFLNKRNFIKIALVGKHFSDKRNFIKIVMVGRNRLIMVYKGCKRMVVNLLNVDSCSNDQKKFYSRIRLS